MVVTAPEIVAIILGPKWTPAIVPFQILTAGIMMRNAYLMAYCLDGALGAMYKRTIRDGIYATGVVLGSLVGSRFGLPGVATGVLLAIGVNYFLGAAMSLSMIQGSWADYFRSQVPGLGLGVLALAIAVPTRLGLHSLGTGSLGVLVITSLTSIGVIGLAIFFSPGLLGEYGRHALRLVTSSIGGQPLPRGVAWVQGIFQGLERRWADTGD
jgi:PST family polysaccharide transporter